MEKLRKLFAGVSVYIPFFIVIIFICFFINPSIASEQLLNLLSSLLEILFVYWIVSFFFKKNKASVLPILIGMLVSILLDIPSLLSDIASFNIQKEWALSVINEPFDLANISGEYFVATYFLEDMTLLAVIYTWLLSSEIPAIVINTIFLIGYRDVTKRETKWSKKALYILTQYTPLLVIFVLNILLRVLLPEGTTHEYALINLFIVSVVMIISRIKRRRSKRDS